MLPVPSLDDRSYQELLDEALARIPVHTPEWTNFNKSDPGVTLLELFAFMTENLLYRANLIPERNRRKFLSLLGVGVQPGVSARGLVSIQNDKGPLSTPTLPADLELRAGSVAFRSQRPLDVLPLEARAYYKRPALIATEAQAAFNDLFASFFPTTQAARLAPYETTLLEPDAAAVDLGTQTVDGSLWLALLLRQVDKPTPTTPKTWDSVRQQVRKALENKVLSLGIVPDLSEAARDVQPGRTNEAENLLGFALPANTDSAIAQGAVQARYRPLHDVSILDDVLVQPGAVEIVLPEASQLDTWRNLEPLEAGVGDLPPALDDTEDEERVLTWLRITAPKAGRARIGWVGINAVMVRQETWLRGETLPEGSGEPDQIVTLSQTPVLSDTLTLSVTAPGESARTWQRLDDLLSADPEVLVPDLRKPPGSQQARLPKSLRNEVYTLDPASGQIRFGDGFHGKRPPPGAVIRADYAYGEGEAGNVERGQISSGPAGLSVSNPVRTWGGAPAQTVAEAEKTIPRFLQHRDRLVNVADFETLVRQTPGVEVGRVEVLAAHHPELSSTTPGDAPGAVTLMLVPRSDPGQPDAPLPDQLFMDAVCRYLEPRRLITTELFLRPPEYQPIWVSVGVEVVSGVSFAAVREDLKVALKRFLSPLPDAIDPFDADLLALTRPQELLRRRGWPLGKPVLALELISEVSRVAGVKLVNTLLLARTGGGAVTEVALTGLELPRLVGLSVSQGDAVALDALRGQADAAEAPYLPVPFVPAECR